MTFRKREEWKISGDCSECINQPHCDIPCERRIKMVEDLLLQRKRERDKKKE